MGSLNHKWQFALLPLVLTLAACGQQDGQAKGPGAMPPLPVTVVKMVPADVPVTVEYVGQAVGSREVEVRARVAGILQKRTYTEGASVKAR